jgi:dUTP pyrophosphatase
MYKSGVIPFRGIIDGGYTGNMVISLMNVGTSTYDITKGDRVAQIVPHKIVPIDLVEVDEISPEYNIRGNNGFGSSGK